jgi:hypothetical protein
MTIAPIIWGLLVIAYGASTVPLARQGWGRTPRKHVAARRTQVVYHPRLSRLRRAGRLA